MAEIVPQAAEFNDLTIFAFIRIMGKTLVEELYPLSCDLQASFTGKTEIYE
ncbi:MAG: hypothetical protein IJV62_04430 [Eggerthellaceae bacterium]|nr:hypothetical protein [Eggerthellaceae bacterium]